MFIRRSNTPRMLLAPIGIAQRLYGFIGHRSRVLSSNVIYRNLGVYEKSKFFIPEEKELMLFKMYKDLHGHLIIKQRYVIPVSDPWPDWSHGFKLGNFTSVIRKKKKTLRLHPKAEAFFSKLGFLWNFPAYQHDLILQAFQTYKVRVGDINKIPYKFEVPKDDFQWPQDTWGVKLGKLASRYRKQYKKEKKTRRKVDTTNPKPTTNLLTTADGDRFQASLQELGFRFTLQKQSYTFQDIVHCLHIYQSIHGDLLVPQHYRIGATDKRYPKEMRAKPLGQIVSNIRSKRLYEEHQAELLTMGFTYFPMQSRCEKIYQAIEQYQQQHRESCTRQHHYLSSSCIRQQDHDGKRDQKKLKLKLKHKRGVVPIPSKYVIPYNDAAYDPSVWGLNIGTIVSDIRNKGTFADYQEKWIQLGIISEKMVKNKKS